jgi:hypothetical protein
MSIPFEIAYLRYESWLAGVAKHCQERKKHPWKEKNRPLSQAGLLVIELCSITFLFTP